MLLLETIQILNGKPQRLDYHNDRLNRSRNQLMCSHADIYLEDYLQIPAAFSKGKVKCRVIYAQDVSKVEFGNYSERKVNQFILQKSNIDYSFKYAERSVFEKMKAGLPIGSEIIIVKGDLITDTSFSNIIFKNKAGDWITPNRPLLEGTQREFLLDEGLIEERTISINDLGEYSHFMLINAMLDFDETRAVRIDKISH